MAKTKAPEKLVKKEFCKILEERGFQNVKIAKTPADITAELNGEQWWFEIKSTVEPEKCWGSSSETEWKKAFEDPNHFRFVVIWTTSQLKKLEYLEYTPEEFMRFCYVTPFSVQFNIPTSVPNKEGNMSFGFNKEVFNKLHSLYDEIRKSKLNH